MSRNKAKTKEKILRAAIAILTRSGFSDFGINRIAKEAGHDKVLIYRYFSDIEGLLRAIANEIELFPELTSFRDTWRPNGATNAGTLVAYLRGYIQEIHARPLTLMILNWENVENNLLVSYCRTAREEFEIALLHDICDGDEKLKSDLSTLFNFLAHGLIHQCSDKGPHDRSDLDNLIIQLCERLLPDSEINLNANQERVTTVIEEEEDDPNSLPTELL